MIVDAHQHSWKVSRSAVSWITPELDEIFNRDFWQSEIGRERSKFGISKVVLVQAADTKEDTVSMLQDAKDNAEIAGVVGWLPFDSLHKTQELLAEYEVQLSELNADRKNAPIKLLGFRNLTHDYSNPKYENDDYWIKRDAVLETLAYLDSKNYTLDFVAENLNHLDAINKVASNLPNLKIVIDHFGKPNIENGDFQLWNTQISKLASNKNLYMKFSGLATCSKIVDGNYDKWLPYFDFALKEFTSKRLMLGSDWPVCTLANTYTQVWDAQISIVNQLAISEQEDIKFKTAMNFYNLN